MKKRVIVVGGGLAGLSAAESIARDFGDHFEVTLLEAKRTVGGRAGSFRDGRSEEVDYCQHVAMGCCTNFINLLARCNLSDAMDRSEALQFYHPQFPPSIFAASPWLPPPLHLAKSIANLRYLSASQKTQVRRGLWNLMRCGSEALAGQTALQWLQQQGQDPATIREFWDVILVSALGEETRVVSMKAARKVLMDGFASARGASDLLVPKLPLRELFGDSLTKAVRELGVNVKTGVAVRCVRHSSNNEEIGKQESNNSRARVETKRGDCYEADHVIVAVPWHSIGHILSDLSVAGLKEVEEFPASPISGLHLWFDRKIADQVHAVLVGTISQWLFRRVEAGVDDGAIREHYYQVVISGSREAREMPSERLIDRVLEELRSVFPLAREARLLRSRIVTDPLSVFSIRPEVEALRPPAHTALPWLHLAGDWIQTGWPATMEGAVISGRMAANSLVQQESFGGIPLDPGLSPSWLARWMIRK